MGVRPASMAMVLLALATAPAASAATLTVTTTADEVAPGDGTCSLREAISAVDAPPGDGDCATPSGGSNTVVLGAGTYALTRGGGGEDGNVSGDLDTMGTSSTLAIEGAGAATTVIDASAASDRALDLHSGGPAVTLSKLGITGGHAPDGAVGSDGSAGMFPTNGGPGSDGEAGGGIRAAAALTLVDCAVTSNRAGNGGNGGRGGSSGGAGSGYSGGAGGNGGSGGGISSTAALVITRSVIADNRAGEGGDGAGGGYGNASGAGGGGGRGGGGGGVDSATSLTMTESTVSDNQAGTAGAGGSGGPATGSGGGGGGGGSGEADGGGIRVKGSGGTVATSTISGNFAGAGGAGGGGGSTTDMGSGQGGAGGAGGYSSWGGGIEAEAPISLTNVTVAGNFAGAGGAGGNGGVGDFAGAGGPGGDGAPGGSGGGFAAIGFGASGTLLHVTVAQNASGAGGPAGNGGGVYGSVSVGSAGTAGAAGTGGGTAAGYSGSPTALQNTIVSSNGGGNCAGGTSDGGGNLVWGDATCPGRSADPVLTDLRDNGGPTRTMALGAGSPAIDAIAAIGAGCSATDQRGVARPQPGGGMCDIGAYEYAPPSCRPLSAAGGSGEPVVVQLACTDPAGAALTYAIDTPPSHGTLGPADNATGRVTYTSVAGYGGADAFTYHATSNNGTASGQTASLTVNPRPSPTTAACVVPKLKGRLKRAKKTLRRANCKLGKVKGPSRGKVKKQRPKPGTVLAVGSKVNVKLG